jgi:hypothetical protein
MTTLDRLDPRALPRPHSQRQRTFDAPERAGTRFSPRLFLVPGIVAGGVFGALTGPLALHGHGWLLAGEAIPTLAICVGLRSLLSSRRGSRGVHSLATVASGGQDGPGDRAIRTPTVLRSL